MQQKIPDRLTLKLSSQKLELHYSGGNVFLLESELLRVCSPSAEVRGHGKPVPQAGKRWVRMTGLERVGNYAIKIDFSDGHNSGLYDWSYLYDLCVNSDHYWKEYLQGLHVAGLCREPDAAVLSFKNDD